MGRPTKFTEEVRTAILNALRIGATKKVAAEAARIDYDTFNNWINKGKMARRGEYFQFFGSVRQAEAECLLRFTSIVTSAASDGDWRAAIEFLKRRDRKEWGDSQDVTSLGDRLASNVVVYLPAKDEETTDDTDEPEPT